MTPEDIPCGIAYNLENGNPLYKKSNQPMCFRCPAAGGLRQRKFLKRRITMTPTINRVYAHPRTRWFAWPAVLMLLTSLHAAPPTPLVQMHFDEGSGTTMTNVGTLGGSATFNDPNASGYPMFTDLVAAGIYTPAGNSSSVDFGNLGAGQGGQQVNLVVDANIVADGSLGTNLTGGFTVCGWLNCRNLSEGWGGNRIAYALSGDNSSGFDLVQKGNGALQIGLGVWPDSSPAISSSGKITADSNAGPANWVFFAATYDPTLASGNTKFFFGGPTNLASLDSQFDYTGSVANAGPLTVGNASQLAFFWNGTQSGSQSRVFQGLIDELQVFNQPLSLADIQSAQLNGTVPPVPAQIAQQPAPVTVFAGQPANFTIKVNGSAPITYQWQTNGVDVSNATNAVLSFPATTTAMSGTTVQVLVGNPYVDTYPSTVVTMTVLPETGLKILTSLSASPANNAGDLGGYGVFSIRDNYPQVTTRVPSGAYAPPQNIGSVEFGDYTDPSQYCGRAVDFTNVIGNNSTMGSMSGFTICGWLNCSDLTTGSGGNRIAYCLDSTLHGFDVIYDSFGELQLGVNQWPDVPQTPAISAPVLQADPTEGAANWVFFAITYDGTQTNQNVSFYSGSGDRQATLDYTTDYPQGVIPQSGPLISAMPIKSLAGGIFRTQKATPGASVAQWTRSMSITACSPLGKSKPRRSRRPLRWCPRLRP